MTEDTRGFISNEDRLALITDLNEDGTVDGHDDYQSMIRRALNLATYAEADELREEYGLEN